MASLVIIGGVATMGYLLNKLLQDKQDLSSETDKDMVQQTTQYIKDNNIIDTSYVQETLNEKEPQKYMNSNSFNQNDTTSDTPPPVSAMNVTSEKNSFISPLTGVSLSKHEWQTNDQGVKIQKFYGGRVTQNVNLDKKHTNLGWMTGTDYDLMKNKKIAKRMFPPTKNLGNVNGASIYGSDLKHRYNTSRYTNGERPFEQIQVAPGLNKGYTTEGSGGFHQADTRDYVMPKSVDQLRTLNNPKLTYKSRISAPKKSIDSRGKMGLMFKNKVETTFNKSHKDLLVTTGAVKRESGRSTIIVKNTNRQISHNIMGNAKYTVDTTVMPGTYEKSNKLTYCNDQMRNVNGEYMGQNEQDDYGKQSFFIDINKRNVTELRTHTTNVVKAVKAIISPITDLFKPTIKETTEANSNMGNVGQQVFRTIMKDKDNLQLKTTQRETLDTQDTYRNISAKDKATYTFDPNDVLKTTVKETTSNNMYISPGISKDVTNGYSLFNKENHKTSGSREETLQGRTPTNSNVSLSYGASDINVSTGKHNCDYMNQRGLIKTSMNYTGSNIDLFKNTETSCKDRTQETRSNINILSQLKNNPYTV